MTVIKINITTVFAWLTVIYALKYLEPTVVLSIVFGVLPISTMIVSFFQRGVAKPSRMDFLFSSILLCLIGLLCLYVIKSDLLSPKQPLSSVMFGTLLCIISSAANAYNTVYAKILSQAHFSAAQVLSVRFYLACFIAFILLIISQEPMLPTQFELGPIGLIAITSTIIPIYFVQLGVGYSDAIAVSLITPILPALTFFLELLEPSFHFSSTLLILISLNSITILTATIYKIYTKPC